MFCICSCCKGKGRKSKYRTPPGILLEKDPTGINRQLSGHAYSRTHSEAADAHYKGANTDAASGSAEDALRDGKAAGQNEASKVCTRQACHPCITAGTLNHAGVGPPCHANPLTGLGTASSSRMHHSRIWPTAHCLGTQRLMQSGVAWRRRRIQVPGWHSFMLLHLGLSLSLSLSLGLATSSAFLTALSRQQCPGGLSKLTLNR